MKRRAVIRIIVLSSLMLLVLSQFVFADSSWCWLTDTRPFDILPPVALATIVIEVLAIWLIPNTGKLMKTAVAVILANAASFLLPYSVLVFNQVYPKFEDVLLASGEFSHPESG